MRKWGVIGLVSIFITGALSAYFLIKSKRSDHPNPPLYIKGPYFVELPITDSPIHTPCIEIEIEGKKIKAEIDLGSQTDIVLPEYFLKELSQKSFIKQTTFYGIRGKKYNSNAYIIPKIQAGDMIIHQVIAKESNTEFIKDSMITEQKERSSRQDFASVGWGLFCRLNFFLDYENNKIAFCDSIDTLKKQGYPVDFFIQVPFLLDRNLIEFEAKTNKGKMKCVLDTDSTWNILNKDLENGSNDHMLFNPDNIDQFEALNPHNADLSVIDLKNSYDTSVFKIGKKDFGKTAFIKVKIPLEIDGFIGMEFLDDKLVFIDFPNRKLYFYQKKSKKQ